ncbi:MAG: hypothetical protein KAR65_03835 [Anaerolineales bacterium]|nr:hypothetical protein [Anaerolineales bacterium]MCK5633708.1 hypothetical protein [Anaerolineales bacterium]
MDKSANNAASNDKATSSDKATSNPFARALKVFLRLLVSIVLGLSIGLGLYFGGKITYQLAVGPGPSFDQDLADIQEEVAQLQFDLTERDLDINEQRLELEKLANDFADQIAVQSVTIDGQMNVLAADLGVLADRMDTLEKALTEAGHPVDEMQAQIKLIQAMTILSRAQYWLSDANLGQASEDVASARALIDAQAELWRGDPENEDRTTVLDEVVDRLDIALDDIRTQPTIAEDEIEIAWKLLIAVTNPEDSNPE